MGPWQCSTGNAGPLDLLTSDFPSRSSLAPKGRRHGTDTLCFPPTCSRTCTRMCTCAHVYMCMYVCKDPPYSTDWA